MAVPDRRGRKDEDVGRGKVAATVIAAIVAISAVIAVSAWAIGDDGDGDNTSPAAATSPSTSPSGASEGSEPTADPSPTASPTPTESPTTSPTPTPSPTPEALLAAGDSGDEVRELQARLKQIEWYSPDITGEYDDTTVTAVEGFQDKRGFEASGEVDEQTWDKLVEMTREPTDDEKHNRLTPGPTILGPGDSGDEVRELQARMQQIGWFSGEITPDYGDATTSAVDGFQTKRGFPSTGEVDERTWDKLVEMTREPTDDEMHNREPEPPEEDDDTAALDERCLTGRALCIDKTSQSLRWVVDGEVSKTFDVRFGSELTPTREGAFSVEWKSRDHVSSIYDSPMPYAMFFSGGQAVHYSSDFADRGYNGSSHGCVNVRDKSGIAALFDTVDVGDKVIVYWS